MPPDEMDGVGSSYWLHEECDSYEAYSADGFLGRIDPPWKKSAAFGKQSNWKVWCCNEDHPKCSKLVAQKTRDAGEMLRLLGDWLGQSKSKTAAEHFETRPT